MIRLDVPLLLSTVILPMLISLVFPMLGRRVKEKVLAAISSASLLYSLIVITALIASSRVREGVVDPVYFTHAFVGSFTMLLDPLSSPVAFSIALVTALVAIYSLTYMGHRMKEMREEEGVEPQSWGTYYMLYTMFSSAMIGTVLSTNLIEFYVFLELTLIPSFLLIAFYGYGERMRIALMYLLWTHIGALVFFLGVLVLGINTRIFDILNVETLKFYIGLGQLLPENLRMAVAIVIVVGLFVKMAVFGVHIWLPYAHAEAPTPVSALLSPNLIGIAGYALVRITYTFFPQTLQEISIYLLGLALLTMIYGGLMALAQDDFKRFLAYSSISQMGYILLGISTLNSYGITGAILHYASHAVGKAVLFMVAGVLICQLHGLRSIGKMGGLAAKMPLTASLALIGFMHITGVPPSLGLWSEILILFGAVGKASAMGSASFTAMIVVLVVAIGLSTAYAFVTMKRVFFGELSERLKEEGREAGWILIGSITVIAAVGVFLFLYPTIFIDSLVQMISNIYG
ncbi:MAG: NuoM family protein [Candidatus Geothermarchaeales archaeon]